jgi:light-harvesting complex I chlorophyll a/b binding protein 1
MLAWLGFVAVDNGARIYPLPDAYQGLTSVSAHDALVENGAMGQLLLFIGLAEMVSWIGISQMLQGSGRKVRGEGGRRRRERERERERREEKG